MTSGREAARAKCVQLAKQGCSSSVIARQAGIPVKTVQRWMRAIKGNPAAFERGPWPARKGNVKANRKGLNPLSVTDRIKIREAIRHNPRRSLRKTTKAVAEFGISASRETIRKERMLEGLDPLHRSKKPALEAWQRSKRVVFCKNRRQFNWFDVASADEVEVSVMGALNTHNMVYYGYPGSRVPQLRTFKFPASKKYFCAVTPFGAPDPIEITGMRLNRSIHKLNSLTHSSSPVVSLCVNCITNAGLVT
jgi:hypothetical protein